LLESARLRMPWGTAVAELLRAQGLLDGGEGPRTAEELAAWTRSASSPAGPTSRAPSRG
jgi:cobalt/nickel transport system ATP-binding protein